MCATGEHVAVLANYCLTSKRLWMQHHQCVCADLLAVRCACTLAIAQQSSDLDLQVLGSPKHIIRLLIKLMLNEVVCPFLSIEGYRLRGLLQ